MYSDVSDHQLLDLLHTEGDRLPRAAVDEILRRGKRLAPHLIEIIDTAANWEAETPRWWAVVHATFLLAAIRPSGSLEAILHAIEEADEHDVDWIFEESDAMLSAFGPAAIPTLKSAAVDRSRGLYFRSFVNAGLCAIGTKHPETRAEVTAIFRSIAENPGESEDLRGLTAGKMLHFPDRADRTLLLSLEGEFYSEEDVEAACRGETIEGLEEPRDWLDFYADEAIAARQKRWAQEDRVRVKRAEKPGDSPSTQSDDIVPASEMSPPPPPIVSGPKIGRNDPCPCGSGKKYKRCCLDADTPAPVREH